MGFLLFVYASTVVLSFLLFTASIFIDDYINSCYFKKTNFNFVASMAIIPIVNVVFSVLSLMLVIVSALIWRD